MRCCFPLMACSTTNRETPVAGPYPDWNRGSATESQVCPLVQLTKPWRRRLRAGLMTVLALAVSAGDTFAVAPHPQQSATLTQVVNQADPALQWVGPAAIPYGTALGPTQLAATAGVPGTFFYTPSAGTLPLPGTQTLSVAFTPANPGYRNSSLNVDLIVTSPGSSSFQLALADSKAGPFTVSPNRTTSILLTVSPVGDFHQPVSLSCSPSFAFSCTFTPAVVRPTTAPVQVTLALRGTHLALSRPLSAAGALALNAEMNSSGSLPLWTDAGLQERPPVGRAIFACVAWLAWFGIRRRRLPLAFRGLAVLIAIAALLPVCGATLGCGSGIQEIRTVELIVTGSSLVESRSLVIAIGIPPK